MESFDEEDDLALPVAEKPSSPLPKPKLKRLKRATSPSLLRPLANPGVSDDATKISAVASEPGEIRTGTSCEMEDEGLGEETAQELDPLFAYGSGEGILGDPYVQEVDVSEVRGGKGEEEGAVEELVKEHNVKRRLRLEDEGGDPNTRRKKKGKSRKLEGADEKPKESVRERKRLEKARKAELEHLHAESQRLLRETRDAAFKPAQLIQKPISSVLEKIRLRKLEILKSCSILSSLPSVVDTHCSAGSDGNSDAMKGQSDIKETEMNACVTTDVGSEGTCPNLINDTQVDKSGSQLSTGGDKLFNSQDASPPSYPTTSSLKIDDGGNDDGVASSSDNDISSSEEDSDKENIGPRAYSVVNKDLSPKDDIAKAFLDVEAEEEDDSDCDLLRFQENEEESDTDEHEELDDLIATGYKEAPMDQEKRNELHQKWLEQQDAAETDNVIQRLKSGRQGLGKPALIHGDHDNHDASDNDDDEDNNSDDEAKYKNHPIDTSRQSLKKAKQMISHMFTDANDVYIPSDDEETEKNLIRQHIKHSEEPSFITPVEDESSREFFSLIKKLNIAPTTKKRGKASAPALFDSVVLSGSSNSSSKSSFLNRASNSLPSSHKQGSISVRTFIFGRDDSNSRSNISTSEINSEMAEMESMSAKNSMNDKLSSKLKSSVIKRTVQSNSESSSLFNILRQSSIHFDKKLESKNSVSSHVITESQAAYKFPAFLRRNSKMDSRT
ncbi:hypothetical protein KFK09_015839 [Dendrobium nobile]|uniref:Uncharacterized protein n=1 Tax=Dendrobium nobile TaxID=94219 RepID=A0A8T3B7E2_DENNO|nr:hypothetical protein KFK09_015839 [Dendrobium nobile]